MKDKVTQRKGGVANLSNKLTMNTPPSFWAVSLSADTLRLKTRPESMVVDNGARVGPLHRGAVFVSRVSKATKAVFSKGRSLRTDFERSYRQYEIMEGVGFRQSIESL
jgi:hypothetical protein